MSAIINRGSSGCLINQEIPEQNLSVNGKIYDAVKGWLPFLMCGGAAYAAAQTTAILVDKYDQSCRSIMQSSHCTVLGSAGVASGIIAMVAGCGMLKLATGGWGASSAPIRNPSVIPSGPPQAQPNAFFRSQQNGGPARYAEDDLQGTHRKPLGNYDPVQWDSGSQSI